MPVSDWMPSVDDIGDILRARTKDDAGNELGTFTSDTRPTDVQVNGLIEKATRNVAMRVGVDLPRSTWEDAKGVVATKTAMLVEIGFFPEQINRGSSPYPQLEKSFSTDLADLIKAVTAAGGNPGEAGAPLKPSFSFPMTGDPFIIGRRTSW